jgi:ssDNA-binding Zn-finger/Zn-ribbon topoisomerase 1
MTPEQLCPKCGSKMNIFFKDNDKVYRCLNKDCRFTAETEEEFQIKHKSIDDDYTIKNLRIILQGATRIETDLRNDITALRSENERLQKEVAASRNFIEDILGHATKAHLRAIAPFHAKYKSALNGGK